MHYYLPPELQLLENIHRHSKSEKMSALSTANSPRSNNDSAIVPYHGRVQLLDAQSELRANVRSKVVAIMNDVDKSPSYLSALGDAQAAWKLMRGDLEIVAKNVGDETAGTLC
jgi:hypothetical protein